MVAHPVSTSGTITCPVCGWDRPVLFPDVIPLSGDSPPPANDPAWNASRQVLSWATKRQVEIGEECRYVETMHHMGRVETASWSEL
jgi:hypothetical protein